MISNFEPRKDYITYIKIVRNLINKRSDISFLAVGNGSTFNTMKNMISKNEVDRIKLLGRETDIESIINMCDIGVLCVLTPHGEGILNSIIEYMLFGKPVICTAGGGIAKIVFHNKNGWICQGGDYVEISDKIEYLIENPRKYANMSNESFKTIRSHFSSEIMTENYMKVYKQILNN